MSKELSKQDLKPTFVKKRIPKKFQNFQQKTNIKIKHDMKNVLSNRKSMQQHVGNRGMHLFTGHLRNTGPQKLQKKSGTLCDV